MVGFASERRKTFHTGQWPKDDENWLDAFFGINRAPIFRDTIARMFRGEIPSDTIAMESRRNNWDFARKRFRGITLFAYPREVQKSVEELRKLGIQPVEKLKRVISLDWNVGDRVEAVKDISYNGGAVITKGSVGVLVKEHLDRQEYMGVIFDQMKDQLLGAQPHEIMKEAMLGAMCFAKRPESCRWPILHELYQGDYLRPTMHEEDASLRLRFRMGFIDNTVALEHTHKANVYICLNNKEVQFGDYHGRQLDNNCSFWVKRVSDYVFRLESCYARHSYLGVTQPLDPMAVRPAVLLMENNASSAFKEATAFMFKKTGESAFCEQVYTVEAYHLGGQNIAVTWSPNVGKVRIWMQQKRRWLKVQDTGGREQPCAWVFALDELDPVRVCVAPHTLRHFFNDVNKGEWTRFGGNVSDWVDIPVEESPTGSPTPTSSLNYSSSFGSFSKFSGFGWTTGGSESKRTSNATDKSLTGRTARSVIATPKSHSAKPSVSGATTPKVLARRSSRGGSASPRSHADRPSVSSTASPNVLARKSSRIGSTSPRSHGDKPSASATPTPKVHARRASRSDVTIPKSHLEGPSAADTATPKVHGRRTSQSDITIPKSHAEKLPAIDTETLKVHARRPSQSSSPGPK
eukprot:GEMP01026533.1.p1 GENE.GEMP01026533.1~~GEMP01026533.1.p1  ORF type:complete len:633 (+),score=106.08 GEMP01026533.1:157-2055(+)